MTGPRADAVAERHRVQRAIAGVLRDWLVTNDPVGAPLVPVRHLRDELYALREAYPGDRRTARAQGYLEALRDLHRLLDRAEKLQPAPAEVPQ